MCAIDCNSVRQCALRFVLQCITMCVALHLCCSISQCVLRCICVYDWSSMLQCALQCVLQCVWRISVSDSLSVRYV